MSETHTGPMSTGAPHPLTNTALGLAVASVIAWIALLASDAEGPIWMIQVVLSVAAAVTGWMAGGRSPSNRAAFAAVVIGALGIVSFLGWLISQI